jgi:hypothetical protein
MLLVRSDCWSDGVQSVGNMQTPTDNNRCKQNNMCVKTARGSSTRKQAFQQHSGQRSTSSMNTHIGQPNSASLRPANTSPYFTVHCPHNHGIANTLQVASTHAITRMQSGDGFQNLMYVRTFETRHICMFGASQPNYATRRPLSTRNRLWQLALR